MAKPTNTLPHFNLSVASNCACGRATDSLVWILLTIPFAASLCNAYASPGRPHVHIAMAASDVQPTTQVSFETVEKGIYTGVKARLQIVIRDQSEWKDLWQQHASIRANQTPPPAIDFRDRIVVAVFLGDKPTGGYEIFITRAERTNDVITVLFIEKEPRPGSITTQAFTQPFHIVQLAIAHGEKVVFRRLP